MFHQQPSHRLPALIELWQVHLNQLVKLLHNTTLTTISTQPENIAKPIKPLPHRHLTRHHQQPQPRIDKGQPPHPLQLPLTHHQQIIHIRTATTMHIAPIIEPLQQVDEFRRLSVVSDGHGVVEQIGEAVDVLAG
jgi:hypothetical protein